MLGTVLERGATHGATKACRLRLAPRCPHCGGLARPAVVWFGESLRGDDLRAALRATACDLFIAVARPPWSIPPPVWCMKRAVAEHLLSEINLEATPASAPSISQSTEPPKSLCNHWWPA